MCWLLALLSWNLMLDIHLDLWSDATVARIILTNERDRANR